MKESKKDGGWSFYHYDMLESINFVNARYASFRGMWDIREIGDGYRNEYPAVGTCLQLETTSKSFGIVKDRVHCMYNAAVKQET